MVHWDVIGDGVSVYLRESKASEEAKRRGLIPMKRRGLYADPRDPSTAVAKAEKGGTVLARIGKKPTTKPTAPTATPERPQPTAPTRPPSKPAGPRKPVRRGKVTPGGDAKKKQEVLDRGFVQGVAAPGTKSSALNEILVGESLHMITQNPAIAKDDVALALQLYKYYSDTTLGKQNMAGIKLGSRTRSGERVAGLDKILFDKLLSTARAGIREAHRISDGMRKLGWSPEDVSIDHYYGHADSKKAQIAAIGNSRRVITPTGVEIPKDVAVDLVKKGGGGANPSDTAISVRHRGGDLMLGFTSNKLGAGDAQANSTLKAELEEVTAIVDGIKGLDNTTKKVVRDHIEDIYNEIKAAEGDLGTAVIKPLIKYFQKHGAPAAKVLMVNMQKREPKRWKKLIGERFSAKVMLGPKSHTATQRKAFEMVKKANPKWNGKREPTDLEKLKAYMLDTGHRGPTSHDIKLLSRSAKGIKGAPDAGKISSKIRGDVLQHLAQGVDELNKTKTKGGFPLGNYVEGKNLENRLHLQAAFEESKEGVHAYGGLFEVNMGGIKVSKRELQTVLGLNNEKDYLRAIRVGKPQFTKDERGNITGERVQIYALGKKGKQIPIADRHVRSKSGVGGKLETVYKWHPSLQRKFKELQGK